MLTPIIPQGAGIALQQAAVVIDPERFPEPVREAAVLGYLLHIPWELHAVLPRTLYFLMKRKQALDTEVEDEVR